MIENIFKAVPYLRRPFFQRDVAQGELHAARSEIASLRREIERLRLRHGHVQFDRSKLKAPLRDNFFALKDDDARQNERIGNLRDYVKKSITKRQPSLEIGPSYNPILPKREGFNVSILDHDDKAALEKKYTDHKVDLSRIEPVDFIWTGGSMLDVIGGTRFDNIVAAHVIEHAPDFIQFFSDCSAALNANGRLYLFVPDKRYCFDYFQPLSDPAKILGDHRHARSRHSFESFYRNGVMVLSGGEGTWGQAGIKELTFLHGDPVGTLAWADARLASSHYEDAHENYFTPVSFSMIVDELYFLGVIDLQLEVLTRSRGCEFLAVLKKTTSHEKIDLKAFLERKLDCYALLQAEELERIEFAFSKSAP
jgi:hypothetical protein